MSGSVLVIPAWNEPEAIGAVLDEVPPGWVDQVLVVVGSADDPTIAVVQGRGTARVLVQPRPGYGAACWTGAQAALEQDARIIAFLDGDYADPPAALPRIVQPLLEDRADLVLGCRDLRQHPEALPKHAQLGNRLVLGLLRALLHYRFDDLPSFKAIRGDALRVLRMREMTYGWTVEMLVKARRCGLRIEQVTVDYRPRLGGRSKVAGNLRASVRAGSRLVGCALAYTSWRPTEQPV